MSWYFHHKWENSTGLFQNLVILPAELQLMPNNKVALVHEISKEVHDLQSDFSVMSLQISQSFAIPSPS